LASGQIEWDFGVDGARPQRERHTGRGGPGSGKRRSAPCFRSVAWVVHPGYSAMFGALVWSVHIAFVWPLWALSVGVPSPPMVPFLNEASLLSYVLFGALLGTVVDIVD
jgi:hypothetical protein